MEKWFHIKRWLPFIISLQKYHIDNKTFLSGILSFVSKLIFHRSHNFTCMTDSFLLEKFLPLLSAPCITPPFHLSSFSPFHGRRRRDKIFLPYRAPIKIGYPWWKTAGRRSDASRDATKIVLREKKEKKKKKTGAPQSPSRRRRDAAQIFRGSLF